jgi:hypothetical protein
MPSRSSFPRSLIASFVASDHMLDTPSKTCFPVFSSRPEFLVPAARYASVRSDSSTRSKGLGKSSDSANSLPDSTEPMPTTNSLTPASSKAGNASLFNCTQRSQQNTHPKWRSISTTHTSSLFHSEVSATCSPLSTEVSLTPCCAKRWCRGSCSAAEPDTVSSRSAVVTRILDASAVATKRSNVVRKIQSQRKLK